MKKKKLLSKKQLAILDDLFTGQLDEQNVTEKHNINRKLWRKWQSDQDFIAEFERRIAALNRQSKVIIARYASLAAAKLVQLTDSRNQETARKACLDIISFPKLSAKISDQQPKTNRSTKSEQLPPETASRLLEALANTDCT